MRVYLFQEGRMLPTGQHALSLLQRMAQKLPALTMGQVTYRLCEGQGVRYVVWGEVMRVSVHCSVAKSRGLFPGRHMAQNEALLKQGVSALPLQGPHYWKEQRTALSGCWLNPRPGKQPALLTTVSQLLPARCLVHTVCIQPHQMHR